MKNQIELTMNVRDFIDEVNLEEKLEEMKRRENEKLDEELKQTFPASDPLSY